MFLQVGIECMVNKSFTLWHHQIKGDNLLFSFSVNVSRLTFESKVCHAVLCLSVIKGINSVLPSVCQSNKAVSLV